VKPSVALGARTHSGWAAYVVLSGETSAPRILFRGVMQLCDPKIQGSKQPFHHAEPMPFKEAEAFIQKCKKSSQSLADQALDEIAAAHGVLKGCCILTASGRPLPDLRAILASHALIHSAEGEFYREVIRNAAQQKGVATEMIRERDMQTLAERLPGTETSRRETLTAFGKQMGSPWRQDEKLAAMAAWFVLAMRQSRIGTRPG
jgi:hypothetical protein